MSDNISVYISGREGEGERERERERERPRMNGTHQLLA